MSLFEFAKINCSTRAPEAISPQDLDQKMAAANYNLIIYHDRVQSAGQEAGLEPGQFEAFFPKETYDLEAYFGATFTPRITSPGGCWRSCLTIA